MASGSANASATKAIFGMIALGGLVFTLPTVLIIGVGMAPTIAAFMIDRRREKYTTLCVGGMNFVGVLPFVIKLWSEDHSYDKAFDILADPFTWLSMMGAAAIGWAIYIVAPGVVAMALAMRIEQRISSLRRRQRDLVEEWGPGVAGSAEVEPEESSADADTDADVGQPG